MITHGVATFGIHVVYAMCLKYDVKFINLRHTKVENLMTFDDGVTEKFTSIVDEMDNTFSEDEVFHANKYLTETKSGKKFYSGHRFFNDSEIGLILQAPKQLAKSAWRQAKKNIRNAIKPKSDYFEPNLNHFIVWFYEYIRRPIKMTAQKKFFIDVEGVGFSKTVENFIFFPLHAEPEVSLSVYAKNYSDQLNFVKNLSLNLPSGFKIYVKDHPRNKGRRTNAYLKRLANMPSVVLIDYDRDSKEIIDKCSIVIMLSGFVGFEALLRKKPVICFGDSLVSNFKNYLPVFPISNFESLHQLILSVSDKKHNFNHLENFIASVRRRSEQIEIMSVLLQKKNRHGSGYSPDLYSKNILNLKKLVKKFIY